MDTGGKRPSVSEAMQIPRAFAQAFDAVAVAYRCSPEEIELMRQAVRGDLAAAIDCITAIAREVELAERLGETP